MNFDSIKQLMLDIERGKVQDDRPAWLKQMPSASDNTAYYYPFFYKLMAHATETLKVLEIGTYRGTSAAHLAYGAKINHRDSRVVTMDISHDAARLANEVALAQGLDIVALVADSANGVDRLKPFGIFDILFIDANHTFTQCYKEYEMYRPLVKNGGFIFFDDISLPMESHEMEVLWELIVDPKQRLDALHYTGFGVAQKDPKVEVPSWYNVIKKAEKRMLDLGWAGPPTVYRP